MKKSVKDIKNIRSSARLNNRKYGRGGYEDYQLLNENVFMVLQQTPNQQLRRDIKEHNQLIRMLIPRHY